MAAQQSDSEHVLRDAAGLVRDILARDRRTPGFALAVMRALAGKLAPADNILSRPTAPAANGIDVDALIG